MAITSCERCGTTKFRSVSTDATGTLATCKDGHLSFDGSTATGGDINIGSVNVKGGASAIGHGAVAICHTDGRKKGRR
ncbi:hypothetical protein [Micromonospora inyonensis]|uniref:Uncharacterized protein n=1 Tax=Micromonospora inyonensis TaxID=47866 RepID=A0A1C6RTR0_9ACTN|nr:hypothetical protein [Micromonospora inyonensis]SCL20459.1 hypothetical protein GA0074694_3044 [Micromonospora inyonensis]SCL25468.1 hypothetical protein GA0074694_4229 [Micromonospora inyonensis]